MTDTPAPAPEAAAPSSVSGLRTFPLSRPIMSMKQEVKELHLREPTGEDLIACGSPVIVNVDAGRVEYDFPALGRMLVRLAGITPDAVSSIAPKDLNGIAMAMIPFFAPDRIYFS